MIGGSGSGKSTLLRCLNLLEQVTDGVITLDGEDITDPRVDADAVRRRIEVFQAYNLFPHMSVLRNVALAPRVVGGMPKPAAEARARELLARVGLADKAGDYPDRLSGGQRRTAIARALAHSPRLLLDELTSALDPELVGEVLHLIRELKTAGMTIVMATDEMGFARTSPTRSASSTSASSPSPGRPRRCWNRPRTSGCSSSSPAYLPQAPPELIWRS